MLNCFASSVRTDELDRAGFKFQHKLLGHPSLELASLCQTLPALPRDQVMYSKSLLKTEDDFESTFRTRPADRSLEETISRIRVSDGYVMVRAPEVHPAFAGLYRELLSDVETLIRQRGMGARAEDAQLYLFIASPNSITPFHIDRYSTFLLQFRGSKEVAVFPQWDERIVTSASREAYITYTNTTLGWTPEVDALATKFTFSPGEALHIPFIAGHHVRNGADDVSISMSIIFNTRESMAWKRALAFNHSARRVLGRVSMAPAPVGSSRWRDEAKSYAWQAASFAKRMLRPGAAG